MIMEEIEEIAREILSAGHGETLTEMRSRAAKSPEDAELLRKLFATANIVRFYRLGRVPERWLGKTEEVLVAKKFLGIPEIQEQKEILRQKGFLREPGEEG